MASHKPACRQAGTLSLNLLILWLIQQLLMHSKKIVAWALIMALGGFLFGFDTAVISGAEQAIQKYWDLDKFQHGLTVAIALIGTVIGALIGGIPADRLGRKRTLIIIAALYFFSSIGTALATNWYLFLLFRFLGGLGVGASSVTAPIYISEISPAASRGRLVALFQLNVVLGILIAYFSNWVIGTSHENSWRWMLGVQAIPSLAFFLLMRNCSRKSTLVDFERKETGRSKTNHADYRPRWF